MTDHDGDPKRRRPDDLPIDPADLELDLGDGSTASRARRARARKHALSDREVHGSSSDDLRRYGTTGFADGGPSLRPARPPGSAPPPSRPPYQAPQRAFAPWLASAALLLAVSMLVAHRSAHPDGRDRMQAAMGDVSRTSSASVGAARVASDAARQRFVGWVESNAAGSAATSSDGVSTGQGIRLLADALREAAGSSVADVERRTGAIRAQADRVALESEQRGGEEAHAAFADAARLLNEMRRGADLQSAADAVRADRPLRAQGDVVRSFFRQAALALR